MLVRFSSIKSESLIMFGDHAVPLIKMLGASGNVPGALSAEDISAALQRLRQQLQVQAAASAKPVAKATDEEDDEEREPPIELATRAAPLIELLERASAGAAPVMWESV